MSKDTLSVLPRILPSYDEDNKISFSFQTGAPTTDPNNPGGYKLETLCKIPPCERDIDSYKTYQTMMCAPPVPQGTASERYCDILNNCDPKGGSRCDDQLITACQERRKKWCNMTELNGHWDHYKDSPLYPLHVCATTKDETECGNALYEANKASLAFVWGIPATDAITLKQLGTDFLHDKNVQQIMKDHF